MCFSSKPESWIHQLKTLAFLHFRCLSTFSVLRLGEVPYTCFGRFSIQLIHLKFVGYERKKEHHCNDFPAAGG